VSGLFGFQTLTIVASAIVSLVVLVAFKGQIESQPVNHAKAIDQSWRLIIGIGMIPAAVALYFRLTIPETPRYTMDVERNIKQGSQDVDTYLTTGTYVVDPIHNNERAEVPKASWADFARHFRQWKNFKVLFGAAWSWFALDIAFYGRSNVAMRPGVC
jgi:PHS family inorganic phosphate transporter-like MFS transporter